MLPRGAIDNGRTRRDLIQQAVKDSELVIFRRAGFDGEAEIGAPEPRHHTERRAKFQLVADIVLNLKGRCGGQREARRPVELPPEIAEAQIVGPEIVSPVRDAMRFVHDEQRWTRVSQAPDEPTMLDSL